jgi:hypothetical protein
MYNVWGRERGAYRVFVGKPEGKRPLANRVLVGKPEGKRPLGRPRLRWEDDIKRIFREWEVGHGLD